MRDASRRIDAAAHHHGGDARETGMFEHLPAHVGHALRRVRPGLDKILCNDPAFADAPVLPVHSRAFDDGARGGHGGEYPLQDGFGWTNGVTRKLLHQDPKDPSHHARAGRR